MCCDTSCSMHILVDRYCGVTWALERNAFDVGNENGIFFMKHALFLLLHLRSFIF